MSFLSSLGLGIRLHFNPGNAPQALNNFSRQVRNVQQQARKMGTSFRDAGRDVLGTVGHLGSMAGALTNIGMLAGGAVTALGGLAVKATSDFMKFDDAIRKVGTAMPETFEQHYQTLRSMAKDAAQQFGISPVDAADAMRSIAKQGVTEMDSMRAFLKHGLALSVADTEIAADKAMEAIMNVVKMFNLEMTDDNVRMISDEMLKAANLSATNITELMHGMKYFGPIASQFKNLSHADAFAGLAMLSERGIKASLAGNALARIYSQQAKGPAENLRKMLGMEATDDKGMFLGLAALMAESADALKQFKEGDEVAFMDFVNTLFEARGSKAALPLMAVTKEIEEMTKKIREANGEAQRAAKTRLDGLWGQWNKVKASIQVTVLEIVEKFGPAVAEHLKGAAQWVFQLAEAFKVSREGGSIDRFSESIQGIVRGVSDAKGKFGELWEKVRGIGDWVDKTFGEGSAQKLTMWAVALAPIGVLLGPVMVLVGSLVTVAGNLLTILVGGAGAGIGLIRALHGLGAAGAAAGAASGAGAAAGAAGGGWLVGAAVGAGRILKGVGIAALIHEGGQFAYRWWRHGFVEAASQTGSDILDVLIPFRELKRTHREPLVTKIAETIRDVQAQVAAQVAVTNDAVTERWNAKNEEEAELKAQRSVLVASLGGKGSQGAIDARRGTQWAIGRGVFGTMSEMLKFEISHLEWALAQKEKAHANFVTRVRTLWETHSIGMRLAIDNAIGLVDRYKNELKTAAATVMDIIPRLIASPMGTIASAIAKLAQWAFPKAANWLKNMYHCRDAFSGAVGRHQLELNERAGATTAHWQRRQVVERSMVRVGA